MAYLLETKDYILLKDDKKMSTNHKDPMPYAMIYTKEEFACREYSNYTPFYIDNLKN